MSLQRRKKEALSMTTKQPDSLKEKSRPSFGIPLTRM
jgi:hypothetical protein